MKQIKTSAFFIILTLILLMSPYPALADQQWHYQASAQVTQPGLIETVLPAGVFFGTDNAVKTSQLDLTLVRPDQVNQLTYDHKDEHADRYVSLGCYHTDLE
jgi:Mg2+/citrate symporter